MKNKFFPKGFTLMEMLIVVIILALVASIGGNTYSIQRKAVRFTDSIVKVSALIKATRNHAVSSRSAYDPDCQPAGEERFVPAEGYGLYISRSDTPGLSRFVIFANSQADNEVEANQFDEVIGSPCDSDLIEEEYLLPVDTEFTGLFRQISPTKQAIGGLTTDDAVTIIFRPPLADATIAVNETPAPADPADLVYLLDLYLEFRRPQSNPSTPSQYIHINQLAGFPETETL